MNKQLRWIAVLFTLVIALTLITTPVQAGTASEPPCSTVEITIYSGVEGVVYYDIANWTTADRRIGWLNANEAHHHTITPGIFEFWLERWDVASEDSWDVGAWVYLPACSRAAAYVKIVDGKPVLKIKAILPETP